MKRQYITEVNAIDPRDGKIYRWMGPLVEAESREAAQVWCNTNQKGYAKVIGLYIGDVKIEGDPKTVNTLFYMNERDN